MHVSTEQESSLHPAQDMVLKIRRDCWWAKCPGHLGIGHWALGQKMIQGTDAAVRAAAQYTCPAQQLGEGEMSQVTVGCLPQLRSSNEVLPIRLQRELTSSGDAPNEHLL